MNNERLCDHTLFMRSILVLFEPGGTKDAWWPKSFVSSFEGQHISMHARGQIILSVSPPPARHVTLCGSSFGLRVCVCVNVIQPVPRQLNLIIL